MNTSTRATLVVVGPVLLALGCVEDHTDAQHSVPLQDATSVEVNVTMNNGDLEIFGGSADLLRADLIYPVNDRPRISYFEAADQGYLDITQPDDDNVLTIDNNRWELQLNEQVELAMFIEMDNGDADLELGSLALRRLEFDMDNGEATFDMTGAPSMDLDARIRVDNGDVHILIPAGVAAVVTADVDIGDIDAPQFARNARGEYVVAGAPGAVVLRFDIAVDAGDIELSIVE